MAVLEQREEVVRKIERTTSLYGLSPPKLRRQFKKERPQDSPGYQCKSESDISKAQSMINAISMAVKIGFVFDYVLSFTVGFSQKRFLPALNNSAPGP